MDTAASAPPLSVMPRVLSDTTAAMREITPPPTTYWPTLRCNSYSPSSSVTPAITTNAMYSIFIPVLVASATAKISAQDELPFVFTSVMVVVDSFIACPSSPWVIPAINTVFDEYDELFGPPVSRSAVNTEAASSTST
ncbi:hypothetical protein MTO96_009613 [Rhipicephalus appendiculatus]